MQPTKPANWAVTTLTTGSFIAWAGPKLLRALHFKEDAEATADMFDLIKSAQISWPAIYFFCFLGGIIGLLFINSAALNSYRKRNHREWNISLNSTLDYIINRSVFGAVLPDEHQLPTIEKAIIELAQKGKIAISGIKQGDSIPTRIPRKFFANGAELLCQIDVENDRTIVLDSSLADSEIIYLGLMMDKADVMRQWPERILP